MEEWQEWQKYLVAFFFGLIASAVILLIARRPSGVPLTLYPPPTPQPYLVHVDGAVNKPGVYPVERGSRVNDAIQAAGGVTESANLHDINLAAPIKDGQKIYIPSIYEITTPPATDQNASAWIDLNHASLEELMTLPGIGEDRAKEIIRYRDSHGGFKTIEELLNITGIGKATFEKIKPFVFITP